METVYVVNNLYDNRIDSHNKARRRRGRRCLDVLLLNDLFTAVSNQVTSIIADYTHIAQWKINLACNALQQSNLTI